MAHTDVYQDPQTDVGNEIDRTHDAAFVETRKKPARDVTLDSPNPDTFQSLRGERGRRFIVLPLMEAHPAQWGIYCRWCGNVFVGSTRRNELHGPTGVEAEVRHVGECTSTSLA
jgi:hypothetical protein